MTVEIRKLIYETVFHTDQFFREKLIVTHNKSARFMIWNVIKTLDLMNQPIIFYMIDRYGWPLVRDYGAKASQAAYYVVMHSEKSSLKKYYPVLKEAAKIEKANCPYACNVLDRLLLYKKRKQLFGNDARGLRDANGTLHYYIYPIMDFKNVNRRRAKIGLDTIENYAEANDYILHYDDDIYQRLMHYPNG